MRVNGSAGASGSAEAASTRDASAAAGYATILLEGIEADRVVPGELGGVRTECENSVGAGLGPTLIAADVESTLIATDVQSTMIAALEKWRPVFLTCNEHTPVSSIAAHTNHEPNTHTAKPECINPHLVELYTLLEVCFTWHDGTTIATMLETRFLSGS